MPSGFFGPECAPPLKIDPEWFSANLRLTLQIELSSNNEMSSMDKNNNPSSGGVPRREFIRKTASAAAAVAAATPFLKTPVYGQNQAPSPGRVKLVFSFHFHSDCIFE